MAENELDSLDNILVEEQEYTDTLFNYEYTQETNLYPDVSIKVEKEQYSIYELMRKYRKDLIILDPEFQREEVWKSNQWSELIESVLMGIPLPNFYLNETKDGKLIVVDGRQRLTTFFRFIDNEFQLKNLKILTYLNGMYFNTLDNNLQAKLEDHQIIAQVIKPPTPDRVKFDIFERVNRGGTQLNQQEMRNALYQGKATNLLGKLANSKLFLDATGHSIAKNRMKDRYMILRLLSFYLWRTARLKDSNGQLLEYRPNELDDFLGKSMERINAMSDEDIGELEQAFYLSMTNNMLLLGDRAYRRTNGERRYPVNLILFESFGYLFTHFSEETCRINRELLQRKIRSLLSDDYFNDLLTRDRGRGIVIPKVFRIIDELKEGLKNDFKNIN